jgi:hypothetical protein
VSSLVIKDVKNKIDHDLITFHCLVSQEYLCAKLLEMTNVITVASELVNFI